MRRGREERRGTERLKGGGGRREVEKRGGQKGGGVEGRRG